MMPCTVDSYSLTPKALFVDFVLVIHVTDHVLQLDTKSAFCRLDRETGKLMSVVTA